MGLSRRRRFSREFKLAALQRLEWGRRSQRWGALLKSAPNVLHRWRREFREGPGTRFPARASGAGEEGRVAQLERKVGPQALEIDFLKECLQRIDEQRKLQARPGKPLFTSRSRPRGTEPKP